MKKVERGRLNSAVVICRIFLIAATLEGILALAYLFRIPSDEQSAYLFGLSKVRLFIGVAVSIPLILLISITIRSLLHRSYNLRLESSFETFLGKDNNAFHLTALLSIGLVYGFFILFLVFIIPKAGSGLLDLVFERIGSLILWMIALTTQSLALILIRYQIILKKQFHADRSILSREGFFFIVAFLTLVQWSILIFHLNWFHQMYGWYFRFWRRNPPRTGLFLALMLLTLTVVWLIDRFPDRRRLLLFVLIGLGYTLQIGFGYIEGNGWESLRIRYVEKGRSIYSEIVSQVDFDIRTLTAYESNYANVYRFLSTKPAGFLVFHAATRGALDLLQNGLENGDTFTALTRFMALVYPLIAMSALPLLVKLTRKAGQEGSAFSAAMIYICFPGIILFTLQLDQVLFPAIFIGGILLALRTSKQPSWITALALGGYFYIGIFFSFSLLSLPIFVFTYLGTEAIFQRDNTLTAWLKLAKILVLAMCAFFIVHVLLKNLMNYDLVERYSRAMEAHRQAKGSMWEDPGTTLLNVSEYLLWAVFSMIPFFLAQLSATVKGFLRRSATQLDIYTSSFVIMMILLNIFGSTRGEVARLWLFTLPALSLLISSRLDLLPFRLRTNTMIICFIQLVTTYLIFLFQFPYQ